MVLNIFVDVQLTWRVDFSSGLKIRLPAVWNLDWNPTKRSLNTHTSIIKSLPLDLISVHIPGDILLKYNVCVTHYCYIIIEIKKCGLTNFIFICLIFPLQPSFPILL